MLEVTDYTKPLDQQHQIIEPNNELNPDIVEKQKETEVNTQKNIKDAFETTDSELINIEYKNIREEKNDKKTDDEKLDKIYNYIELQFKNKLPKPIFKLIEYSIIEFGQNILKHSLGLDNHIKIKQNKKFITMTFSNLFNNNITPKEILENNINKLNNLSKDELKKKYLEQLNNGKDFSDKGGAGLGFIDIVRKIKGRGGNIEVETKKTSEENAKIELTITLPLPLAA